MTLYNDIKSTKVLIRGAGDLASGVAHRLYLSGFKVCLTETAAPMAVRRLVSFSEAVYDGEKIVEGVTATRISSHSEIEIAWEKGLIPLIIDPENSVRHHLNPHVVVDAIIAKQNLGTSKKDAPLVIGLGPGLYAGVDAHVVVETNRGHDLGRLIFQGWAEQNTGVPGTIGGYNIERVLRSPGDGTITLHKDIGDRVTAEELIAEVAEIPIHSRIDGIIRGMLRNRSPVRKGMKIGDVDPRKDKKLCPTISDKARSIGGAVIEAILTELPKRLGQSR